MPPLPNRGKVLLQEIPKNSLPTQILAAHRDGAIQENHEVALQMPAGESPNGGKIGYLELRQKTREVVVFLNDDVRHLVLPLAEEGLEIGFVRRHTHRLDVDLAGEEPEELLDGTVRLLPSGAPKLLVELRIGGIKIDNPGYSISDRPCDLFEKTVPPPHP